MDLQLTGKTALITGASAGIGRAAAISLAREGVHVMITARRENLLIELADEIERDHGQRPQVLAYDFMAADAPGHLAGAALDQLGSVDVLINNAGGFRLGQAVTSDDPNSDDEWQEAYEFNFVRHRQLTQKLLGSMKQRGFGRIINISGKSEPVAANGVYCAKAAMHSWSKGLSREVGPFGITVNCIPPGRIKSEQISKNHSPEFVREGIEKEIPLARYGEPEELADLAVFLASPRGGYITGTVIPVDGGLRRYQF